jgi:hypothetical protein
MIPYELKVCLLMFAIPYGLAMPWIIRLAWRYLCVKAPKCCECGKPIWPFTWSEMCPSRHRRCQAIIIARMIEDPNMRTLVLMELEEWKRR